jgi:hypothetical protein
MNFWRQKLKPPEMEIDKVTEELKEFSFGCMKAHVRAQGPKTVSGPLREYAFLLGLIVVSIWIGILVGYRMALHN